MNGRARRGAALALTIAGSAACATTGAVDGTRMGTDVRTERAMRALDREAFGLARAELLALVSDCDAGSLGTEALLWLAASELDTGNPDGSPTLAVHAAATYLRSPDADRSRRPVARALYRLGVDLGGRPEPTPGPADLEGGQALDDEAGFDLRTPTPAELSAEIEFAASPTPRLTPCASGADLVGAQPVGPLPTTPSPRAARFARLREELAARQDSIELLEAEVATQRLQLAALTAEIKRITELLTAGVSRTLAGGHR